MTEGAILVLNSGSSSVKLALFSGSATKCAEPLWQAVLTRGEQKTRLAIYTDKQELTAEFGSDLENTVESALEMAWSGKCAVLESLSQIRTVGHRVVHGGTDLVQPTVITADVLANLVSLIELAPLHQPGNIKGIEITQKLLPDAMHVAVFDTAYFHELPPEASVYPVPYDWYQTAGIRRFGFHGISHQYCSVQAQSILKRDNLRVISCHLGAGASITANLNNRPIATTMGFTPLEGLVMATRSGSIDPGIILHLLETGRLTVDQMRHALNFESGLLGISGVSSDPRELERLAKSGHERARLALKIYTDSVAAHICALLPKLGGADAIVFTAGVGENSPFIREKVTECLSFLGVRLDKALNIDLPSETEISSPDSAIRVLLIRAREDLAIARACMQLHP